MEVSTIPTDDERREVARRLRDEADYPGYAVQYMEQFIGDLRQVLFGDLNPTADYSEMFDRLADLIEPSCDRDAIVTFAKNLDLLALMVNSQELTNTGQIAGACQNIANGIREAVGA